MREKLACVHSSMAFWYAEDGSKMDVDSDEDKPLKVMIFRIRHGQECFLSFLFLCMQV